MSTEPSAPTPKGLSVFRADAWLNLLTKMGLRGRDKRQSSQVATPQVFNAAPELDDLFHGNDLANRICSLPATESFRHWIELKGGEDDADRDLDKAFQQQCDTLKLRAICTEAATWGRLYGGCIVFLGADDGLDPIEPLDLTRIQSIQFATVYDRFEVKISKWDADVLSPTFGQPLLYQVITEITGPNGETAGNWGQQMHASRCLLFEGSKTARRRKRMLNTGWADSVFVKLFGVIRGYGNVWDSAEVLMQDFAQAVIKIKGLADLMAQHGEAAVMSRLELMDTSRSILRALLVDADNEDFDRKQTPLTGLAELMDRWLHRVSAGAEIPITLLFGMSPGGLNATGDTDVRFFYDMIKARQENEIRPQLEKLITIMLNAKDGPTNGVEPAEWSFDFCSLMQMTDQEKATLHLEQAQADQIYILQGVLSPDEVANSRFGGDDYSVDTDMDDTARQTMDEANSMSAAAAEAALNPPMPTNKPGSKGNKDA